MERIYRYQNYDMLQATLIIVGFFLLSVEDFRKNNTLYTPEYGNTLKKRCEDGITLLSHDKKAAQRNATRTIIEITGDEKNKLVSFFTSLTNAYRYDKAMLAELKTTLGYDAFMKKTQKGNQEATIQFVNTFASNITPYRTDIIAKGIPGTRIDEIIGFGTKALSANVTQESEKEKSVKLTAEQQTEFNAIYTEAIAICKEGQRIFKSDPATRIRFVFENIVAGFGESHPNNKESGEGEEKGQPA